MDWVIQALVSLMAMLVLLVEGMAHYAGLPAGETEAFRRIMAMTFRTPGLPTADYHADLVRLAVERISQALNPASGPGG